MQSLMEIPENQRKEKPAFFCVFSVIPIAIGTACSVRDNFLPMSPFFAVRYSFFGCDFLNLPEIVSIHEFSIVT